MKTRHPKTDLWGVYTIQQTSSKRTSSNIHVYFEYICWTFAGSVSTLFPVQLNPSPSQPTGQVHVKLPGVLVHFAL